MNMQAPLSLVPVEAMKPEQLTIWQKAAQQTESYLTLANIVGVTGGALVIKGLADLLRGRHAKGSAELGAGIGLGSLVTLGSAPDMPKPQSPPKLELVHSSPLSIPTRQH